MITLWNEVLGLDLSLSPDVPALTPYRVPGSAPRGAVIVCPGGGYGCRVEREGEPMARWLNSLGLHAFVLIYRVRPYRYPWPVLDGKRAVRVLRHQAEGLGVRPDQIGIMGFSAGGHLASTVATHFDEADAAAVDAVDAVSCRPDFAILCYPVITLEPPYAHMGSRNNLLGENAPEELVKNLSNHTQVTDQTPPTFLFHTADDPGVPVQNSLLYFGALREHDVPAELHVYEHGRHGVGLAPDMPELATWPGICITWLRVRGIL